MFSLTNPKSPMQGQINLMVKQRYPLDILWNTSASNREPDNQTAVNHRRKICPGCLRWMDTLRYLHQRMISILSRRHTRSLKAIIRSPKKSAYQTHFSLGVPCCHVIMLWGLWFTMAKKQKEDNCDIIGYLKSTSLILKWVLLWRYSSDCCYCTLSWSLSSRGISWAPIRLLSISWDILYCSPPSYQRVSRLI